MTSEIEKVWISVQGLLSKELKGPSFQTWIKPSKLISLTEDKATIAVKNEFNKNFLLQSYFEIITNAVQNTVKRKIEVEIIVKSDLKLDEFIPSIASLEEKIVGASHGKPNEKVAYLDHTFKYKSNLNPSYTFENFVVGPSNQFCHAAALRASEEVNNQYNPLFIYSGVGLGKTHLVNAIANYTLEQDKSANVKYLSSESFTNDLIQSIRTDGMNKFREKYRNVDLLIIDDIQFLEGKEATQEEFFHTFNALREQGKQIILTSDRPPNSLTSITDRLRSRFEGGLIADIQSPDLETRIAIIILKAMLIGIELGVKEAEYIASLHSSNIRELEGALKRVCAHLSFSGEELNFKNIQKILGKAPFEKLTSEAVLKTVASFYSISYDELISPRKSSDLTHPRHVAIYLLHDFYNLSFPRIGKLLSKRSHTSAMYAYKQIKKKLPMNPDLAEEISSIRGVLEKRR